MQLEEFKEKANRAINELKVAKPKEAMIVHHDDADDLCSAAITKKALEREEVEAKTFCLEKVYPEVIEDSHSNVRTVVADEVNSKVAFNSKVAMGPINTSVDRVKHSTVIKVFANVVGSREACFDVSDIALGVVLQHLISDALELILICDAIDQRAVDGNEVREIAVLKEAPDILHRLTGKVRVFANEGLA